MAEVWRARHLTLRTDVAIKFATGTLSEGFYARFEREALLLAQLGSKTPHVVRVTDFAAAPTPYLVMELLDGEGLHEALRRRGRFAPAEVLWVVSQLVAGLDAVHRSGIVHRDIKPSNVFLCRVGDAHEPMVKLLDFGIAKASLGNELDAATREGVVLGTPQYMSPEQIVGDRTVDARADLWALGVVTYRMLVGDMPFAADADYVIAALARSPRPPTALDASLPAALDRWVSRALAKSPEDRFQDGASLLDGLAGALGRPTLASVPLEVRRPSNAEPGDTTETEGDSVAKGPVAETVALVPVQPRRFVRAALLGASLAAAVGVAAWGWGSATPDSAEPGPPPSPRREAAPSREVVPSVDERPSAVEVPVVARPESPAMPAHNEPDGRTSAHSEPRRKRTQRRPAKPNAEARARKRWGDLEAP